MSALTTYLEFVAGISRETPEGYRYRSYEALVLAEGTTWTTARVDNHGPTRLCFSNAHYAARKNGWQYVEGYATAIIPVGHAWCLDGEDIVETTWDTAGEEYRGIAFPLDYVERLTLLSEHWGVLGNDYLDNFALLQKGRTSNHQPT